MSGRVDHGENVITAAVRRSVSRCHFAAHAFPTEAA
jgi:hypothetical protein